MRSVNQNTKHLRRVILFVVAAVAVARVGAVEAAPLGRQLVELESHINWSAVDDAWKRIRPHWVAASAACDDPECVAKQLLDLEAHVKWKAVEAAWTKKRTSWVSDCKTATTEVEVANLLLAFEENVRWQAVDDRWKARRDGWIAQVKGE
jgi:hypothetical protein